MLAAVGAVAGSEVIVRLWHVFKGTVLIECKEMAVAILHFTCPNTNRRAPTGVEMDVQSLRAHWKSTLRCDCPHCHSVHDICVRDEYLNGAVDNLHRLMRV